MDDTETSQSETLTTASSAAIIPACDPSQLKEYFDRLLPLVLGAEDSDLENSLWSVDDTTEKLRRFINDPQVNVIYFTKKRGDKKEEDEQATISYSYTCTQEITYNSNNVTSIAFIKHVPTLDASRAIQSQIQLINLPGPASSESGSTGVSAYEALHSYIHLAVAPYFDAYVREKGASAEGVVSISGKKHDDSKMGIPMAKKKITELELSLLHLQQNVEIPEISLNIHPIVQKTVEKASNLFHRVESSRVTFNCV